MKFAHSYRELKKKIRNNDQCSEFVLNEAEVCLDTIYPETWIWEFTKHKAKPSSTLTFDQKRQIVNQNVDRPFMGMFGLA